MKYTCVLDVKNYINNLKNCLSSDSKWLEDLKWFSNINYTTTSEYLGELLLFLRKMRIDIDMKDYYSEFDELICYLETFFK